MTSRDYGDYGAAWEAKFYEACEPKRENKIEKLFDTPPTETWPEMDAAAYHGLAGEVVNTIDPHTESDRVAILIQFLTTFGNVVGSNPYFQVEATKHHANLFVLLIGKSSKARKGSLSVALPQ
jgi:signal transduction histidine kinase